MTGNSYSFSQVSWIFFVAALVLWTLLVVGGLTSANAAEPAPAVSVISAREGQLVETVRVSGSLVARDEALVHVSEDGMEILEVLAAEGERVERGEVLARLDTSRIEIEQEANEARLLRADAAMAQAKSQIDDAAIAEAQARSLADRSRALQARDVVSQEALEERSYALARATSMLAVAHQSLALAEADRLMLVAERRDIQRRMDRSQVRATAAGVILRRNAEVGAAVGVTSEPLFAIAMDGAIELDGEVSEAGFVRLAPGMAVDIAMAGHDEPVPGRVRLLSGEMNAETRLGRVRIEIEDQPLVVGAFARGEVAVDSASGVLIPATAVLEQEGSTQVLVVENSILVARDVTVGLRAGGLLEIRSGLEPGEQLVLKSAGFLTPGDQIAPVDVPYDVPESTQSSAARLALAGERPL